jgi:hypothetical protein
MTYQDRLKPLLQLYDQGSYGRHLEVAAPVILNRTALGLVRKLAAVSELKPTRTAIVRLIMKARSSCFSTVVWTRTATDGLP